MTSQPVANPNQLGLKFKHGRTDGRTNERHQDIGANPRVPNAVRAVDNTVLSLFSGIGGIELGLQWAGFRVVGQVEIDEWCREVLAKHWPTVPRHADVRTAPEWWASEPRPEVAVLCGGFPCQPFSKSGKRRGTDDDRWMWPEMAATVRAVRPRYVLVENVADLVRWPDAFGRVLSDLHELGFDAEWTIVRASDVGAPHRRDRVYLLAYPQGDDGRGQDEPAASRTYQLEPRGGGWEHGRGHWLSEPEMDRVAHGIPRRMVFAPLHALGNAVVPQISEWIGAQLMRELAGVAS